MRVAALLFALGSAPFASAFTAQAQDPLPSHALDTAAQLRERALADDTGYRIIESLTTEVGPRLPGSEADARAVAWAVAKFESLGFDRVWTEPVTFPKWERRSERAAVVGAHAQPLVVTALGGSPGGGRLGFGGGQRLDLDRVVEGEDAGSSVQGVGCAVAHEEEGEDACGDRQGP